jgi:two-component system LytT family sensor kinase
MKAPAFFQRGFIFHLLFWLMYAVFTILEIRGYVIKKGWLFCIPPLLIFFSLIAGLIILNFKVLIPRLLEKNRIALYIIGNLIIIVLYTLLRSANQQYWDAQVWPDEPMTLQSYFHWNFLYAVWFLLISTMLYYTQKWTEQRQQVKNIQISQLQTELKYLRAQVNPHFLFNGLNTIYGSIDKTNQQARNVLLQFSDLLRYNLYEADVDMVELEKETQYLQNYVALQRARSNSNLVITLDIQVQDPSVQIAPLLFMPFLENAFKFSSRDDTSTNHIRIGLQQRENTIQFSCSNSFEDIDQPIGGIGLTNVTRRLELLYKDRYTLNIEREQGLYSVQLNLLL